MAHRWWGMVIAVGTLISPSAAAQVRQVAGTVTNSQTGQGVADAVVSVVDKEVESAMATQPDPHDVVRLATAASTSLRTRRGSTRSAPGAAQPIPEVLGSDGRRAPCPTTTPTAPGCSKNWSGRKASSRVTSANQETAAAAGAARRSTKRKAIGSAAVENVAKRQFEKTAARAIQAHTRASGRRAVARSANTPAATTTPLAGGCSGSRPTSCARACVAAGTRIRP